MNKLMDNGLLHNVEASFHKVQGEKVIWSVEKLDRHHNNQMTKLCFI